MGRHSCRSTEPNTFVSIHASFIAASTYRLLYILGPTEDMHICEMPILVEDKHFVHFISFKHGSKITGEAVH